MQGFGSNNKNKNFTNLKKINNKQIVNLAVKFHSQGNLQQAIKYYKYCIKNNINDQRVFCNYGIILRNAGQLKDAEFILRKFISINPSSVVAHNNLSGILRELGKLNDAENILKKPQ